MHVAIKKPQAIQCGTRIVGECQSLSKAGTEGTIVLHFDVALTAVSDVGLRIACWGQ